MAELGCFASSASPLIAEIMAASGVDFVVVDLQHGEPTAADLPGLLRAIELGGARALVRVPWCEPSAIMRALDAGADGVIVPMVEDADQAGVAARATRYPGRSYGPTRRARTVDEANATVRCYPMIETPRALDNLDAIAAVEGVDGLFVGPVDLGLGLGIPVAESYRHPDVLGAIDRCVAAHPVVGTVANGTEHARDLFARGVTFVSLTADKALVAAGLRAALAPWSGSR